MLVFRWDETFELFVEVLDEDEVTWALGLALVDHHETLAVWCDVVVQIFPNGVEVAFKYR